MNPGKRDRQGRTIRERVLAMLGKVPRGAIPERLGITPTAVKAHIAELRRMGLIPPSKRKSRAGQPQATNGEPWTDAEDAVILDGLATLPTLNRMTIIAERLPGRTVTAVTSRARVLRPPEARVPTALREWPQWGWFGVTPAVRKSLRFPRPAIHLPALGNSAGRRTKTLRPALSQGRT